MKEKHKVIMAVLSQCFYLMVMISFANAVDLSSLWSSNKTDASACTSVSDDDGFQVQNVQSGHKDEFGYHTTTYDTAFFHINNTLNEKIYVFGQSDECYQCKLLNLTFIHSMSTKLLYMDTRWPLAIAIQTSDSETFNCNLTYHFGENGNYTLFVTNNNDEMECVTPITINQEPRDSNIPIYIALAVYGAFAIIYVFISVGLKEGWFNKILYCFGTDHLINNELGTPQNPSAHSAPASDRNSINKQNPSKPRRLKSLDTFRGISIVIMIFVNYGGGKYWFFAHARWNGLTVADLVFPWFVYIMGVSMTLSFRALVKYKVSRGKMFYKIVRRTIILFALGCILNSGNSIPNFRVPGVLQRFSVSYFVVACLQLMSATPERHAPKLTMSKYYAPFYDIFDYWYEWIAMFILMAVYSCLTFLLNEPGCPRGYIGPGGPLVPEFKNMDVTNCTGGAANYIDRWILGDTHIYQHPTAKIVYHTEMPHDPEGILGSITSIFITFLGLQAGKILLLYQSHHARIKRLVIWGILCGGLGTLLCLGSREDGWIPLNKNLWSTSFVLVMSGTGFILLTFCYITIDVKKWWSGAPFYYPGMNSIVLYCGHELLKEHFPFSWEPYNHTHSEYLAMDLLGSSLWVLIAYYMYWTDFFIKI